MIIITISCSSDRYSYFFFFLFISSSSFFLFFFSIKHDRSKKKEQDFASRLVRILRTSVFLFSFFFAQKELETWREIFTHTHKTKSTKRGEKSDSQCNTNLEVKFLSFLRDRNEIMRLRRLISKNERFRRFKTRVRK